jgi:hypothetical protein
MVPSNCSGLVLLPALWQYKKTTFVDFCERWKRSLILAPP